MCGIIAVINSTLDTGKLIANFKKGESRGPDQTAFASINNVWMGFHRLAINGLTPLSCQPFCIHGIYLVCNGEIYNYKELYASLNITPTTESDCEIIVHLYEKFGIDQTVHMLNASEFSFVLYDSNKELIYAVRDPYGVRPLYHSLRDNMHVFSSELKMVNDLQLETHKHQKPGTITKIVNGTNIEPETYPYLSQPSINYALTTPYTLIRDTLYEAVKKRVSNTEQPMACLLSGGLDSSLITALVKRARYEMGNVEPLETYSIGLDGSEDLKFAAIAAEYIGTKHTTIVVTEDDFFNAIPNVIYTIESYDTTTVRASVGNYLVANYIKKNSKAKVIFNGDGSDEVTGGYLYMNKCPNEHEFDKECKRLVSDIYLFDALRSDKSISSNGLEARTPFLDRAFVQMYLSIPTHVRFTPKCEKQLLRDSFVGYLPDIILYRKKEAFSDGVSSLKRSWYQIIQERIPPNIFTESFRDASFTAEQVYYRSLFDASYPKMESILPYFWMPKYTTSKDCSARTLENY